MKKKLFIFILISYMLIGIIVVLMSCGKKETFSDVVKVWIPGDEQEYKFYFDMFENYAAYLESQGKTFEYNIEQQPWGDYWTKLPLEIKNKRGPDLFLSHVAYVDILVPIAKELSLSQDVLDKFYVTDLYVGENGKPVFIPTVFVSKIIYANLKVVGDLDLSTYPNTWDEFIPLAKSYTDKQNSVIGFDFPFHILWDLAYQNGDRLTNGSEAIFTDLGLRTILQWTEDGVVDYLGFGNGDVEESLYEGTAAFIYGEPWMEFWAPSEVEMVAFPVPGSVTNSSAELSFGINPNVSDEKYEVLNDFVKFMLTDEKTIHAIVKGNSGMPNNKEIIVSYEPFTAGDAVQKTFDANKAILSVPPRRLELVYKTMLENTLLGTSPDDAVREAEASAENIDVIYLERMESQVIIK